MKKIIIVAIFIIAATVANAQFSFGPKAGLNISKETAVFADPRSSVLRFYAGVFVNYKFSKFFSIEPEFIYSGEGTKYTYGDDSTGHVKASYILIPLFIKFTTGFGLYFETAPELREKLSYYNVQADVSVSNPYLRSSGFDWCFGIGYNGDKIVKGLGIDARYITGLEGEEVKAPGRTEFTYKKVIAIGLFYSIPGKHK